MLPLSLILAASGIAADPPAARLPAPFETQSVTHHPKVIGWPEGRTPTAPPGFTVNLFADGFDSPRWLYILPNGDILVAESRTLPPKHADPEKKKGLKESKTVTGGSANRITLLRDADKDGKPEVREVFLRDLNQPFGMCLIDMTLYVANTDSVVTFEYEEGKTKLDGKGRKILDLPAGGYNNHWTRNLLPSRDGKKLYVIVGSGSNVAEHGTANELLRACILEVNPDGTGLRVFAGGLRNPVGMAWEPTTGALWTAVNERDEFGDDLVPDYVTSVKDGALYGRPYAYFGPREDSRRKGERPDLVAKTVVPDLDVGSHTASLGLCFDTGTAVPEKYRGGMLIGQRGSWNRSQFAGYRVAFVPFRDGKPAGPPEDFLTGFIANANDVYGRPVCVAVARDGVLLVTDDVTDRIWRVAAGTK